LGRLWQSAGQSVYGQSAEKISKKFVFSGFICFPQSPRPFKSACWPHSSSTHHCFLKVAVLKKLEDLEGIKLFSE
jgi:hypothetical protein